MDNPQNCNSQGSRVRFALGLSKPENYNTDIIWQHDVIKIEGEMDALRGFDVWIVTSPGETDHYLTF